MWNTPYQMSVVHCIYRTRRVESYQDMARDCDETSCVFDFPLSAESDSIWEKIRHSLILSGIDMLCAESRRVQGASMCSHLVDLFCPNPLVSSILRAFPQGERLDYVNLLQEVD